jgi:hypothetical protein
VDFLLLRSYALGNYEHDWRRKIGGFFHAGGLDRIFVSLLLTWSASLIADLPSVNSLDSFVYSIEKSAAFTAFHRSGSS